MKELMIAQMIFLGILGLCFIAFIVISVVNLIHFNNTGDSYKWLRNIY